MVIQKSNLNFFLTYYIFLSAWAFLIMPMWFGSAILPGDPSQYMRDARGLYLGTIILERAYTQPILFIALILEYLGIKHIGFIILNAFCISFSLTLIRAKHNSNLSKINDCEFIILSFILFAPLFNWYSQLSKEAISLLGCTLSFLAILGLYEKKIMTLNILVSLCIALLCFLTTRPYLAVFAVIPLAIAPFFLRKISLRTISNICFIIVIFLGCLSTEVNKTASTSTIARAFATDFEVKQSTVEGKYGRSLEYRRCLSQLETIQASIFWKLTYSFFNLRCDGFRLKDSQELIWVNSSFQKISDKTNASSIVLETASETLQSVFFNSIFQNSVSSFFISPTLVLMLPTQFVFIFVVITAFLSMIFRAFDANTRTYALILYCLLVKAALTWFLVHSGTAFRISFPFMVFAIFLMYFKPKTYPYSKSEKTP